MHDHDSPLSFFGYDVEAYFYRLGIDETLGRYFCLPPLSAAAVAAIAGRVRVDDPTRPWYPYMRVLLMGFSWSFWLAQRVHVHQCVASGFISSGQVVVEGQP